MSLPLVVLFVAVAWGSAAAADGGEVKYYVVASSYQGEPENLAEIATRFLGDADRSRDIFKLNVGRPLDGGGTLTDPAILRAGWALVLPWDAVGADVRHGTLPVPSGAQPPVSAAPTSGVASGAGTIPCPDASPATSAAPAPAGPGSAGPWAMARLVPEHAWTLTRGEGVMVAVIDSGVDGRLPELAGHLAIGQDIVGGTGRGDTDCLGSGTAMASIVAAHAPVDSGTGGGVGLAPGATVLPLRIMTSQPGARAADQATAIAAAVSAGAKVIALGGAVTPGEREVAAAIASAAAHDVVIVGGAGAGSPGGALLRVGAIGVDNAPGSGHPTGGVDVVAPGIDVVSLGIIGRAAFRGSGAQYAVAYAAGEAALVRSRYPDAHAEQVVHQMKQTADRLDTGSSGSPGAAYGWGLINPNSAVTQPVPAARRAVAPAGSALPGEALLITAVLSLVVLALLTWRPRRVVPAQPVEATGEGLAQQHISRIGQV